MTLYKTRIPFLKDEETSHTSQGTISFSSLAYTSTWGMGKEKSLTCLFNVCLNIFITILSLITQLTMSYPSNHFGLWPTLQATPINMHLDYLSKNSQTTTVFHTTKVILIEFGSLTDNLKITLVLKTQVLINAHQMISYKINLEIWIIKYIMTSSQIIKK